MTDEVTELIQHLRRGAVRVADWSRAADMLEAMQAQAKAARDGARLAEAEEILAKWNALGDDADALYARLIARIAALKAAAAGEDPT